MTRRLATLWRRARRTGQDLDYVGYLSGLIGALALLIATSVIGPTLDANDQIAGDSRKTAYAAKANQ
ncbi:hypothetical protein C0J09_11570 [Bordetella avium]|uniref:hypothetical protein n=1 Tax=Bordetella avium TaxID=521 RepID=UPI000FD9CDDD|nr:hypothetical protein [Bordetella avium]AZY49710.1 hypothetical protein C0J09_11570 [Bordetella avium]